MHLTFNHSYMYIYPMQFSYSFFIISLLFSIPPIVFCRKKPYIHLPHTFSYTFSPFLTILLKKRCFPPPNGKLPSRISCPVTTLQTTLWELNGRRLMLTHRGDHREEFLGSLVSDFMACYSKINLVLLARVVFFETTPFCKAKTNFCFFARTWYILVA